MISYFLPLSISTANHKSVFVSTESNQSLSMWALVSGKGAFYLLFIIYMNWIDKRSQTNECATIANCTINRLLFADNLVLLSSTESTNAY